MNIKIVDNISQKLLDILTFHLQQTKEARLAVAFAKASGIKLISSALVSSLDKGGHVEFLLGLDFRLTEPYVLEFLISLKKQGKNVAIYCYRDISEEGIAVYHPKVYFFKGNNQSLISIGSSNLTAGGLKDNLEINTVIEAKNSEEIVSYAQEIYNNLKYLQSRFEPDEEYISEYSRIYEVTKKKTKNILKDKSIQKKLQELKEKEKSLPSPVVTPNDLSGWQKLVYQKLPKNEFKTSDLYYFKNEFQSAYPENKHVKAKIRQVLQQLRDLGLLEDLGRGKWKKI